MMNSALGCDLRRRNDPTLSHHPHPDDVIDNAIYPRQYSEMENAVRSGANASQAWRWKLACCLQCSCETVRGRQQMKPSDPADRQGVSAMPCAGDRWERLDACAALDDLESQQINTFSYGLYDGLHGMEALAPYATRAAGSTFK
jgi:hypothetical protein